ncbi:MAG: hypothetical protein Q4B45_04395 [Coriobacteriia bacterium]|nr:hypothetical protein [Coriobacteriia bacterium]
MGEDELIAFRMDLLEQLPLLKACSSPKSHIGDGFKAIRNASALLAPSAELPLQVLVDDPKLRRPSCLLRPSVCTSELPAGFTRMLNDDISVASPELALLQLAPKASLAQTVLMASELCGSFAVYRAPAPVAAKLQELIGGGRLRAVDGWEPCLTSNGRIGELWKRPPLTTPNELLHLAELSNSRLGAARLRKAAELVKPNAASPFEVQAGILLGFSRRRGGEGFGDFTHNEKAELSRDAKLLAGRSYCSCDLFWPDGLDIECQSAQFHDNGNSFISDSNRTAALSLMGTQVLPLTFEQLKQPDNFDAFSNAVAKALGRKRKPKSAPQIEAARRLRDEVFCDWWTLPYL